MGSTVLVSAFHVDVWWVGWVGWKNGSMSISGARCCTQVDDQCEWCTAWPSSTVACIVNLVPLTTDWFITPSVHPWYTTGCRDRHAVAKLSYSGVWNKVSPRILPNFLVTHTYTQINMAPKIVRTNLRLWTGRRKPPSRSRSVCRFRCNTG